MHFSNVIPVYFSPTGTTRKILKAIVDGLGTGSSQDIDFTFPGSLKKDYVELTNELVVLGAPVYGGRLPGEAVKRLSMLKGNNTPAVVVVVYGNREFEDALLELRDLAVKSGFIPIAGGAFIGEHSYNSDETPIAEGRPDSSDLTVARNFGKKLKDKILSIENIGEEKPVTVPGSFPYKESMPPSDDCADTVRDACISCDICVEVCPTGAITLEDDLVTDPGLCILCCACVKSCPRNARIIKSDRIKMVSKWLSENCSTPKQPELFF